MKRRFVIEEMEGVRDSNQFELPHTYQKSGKSNGSGNGTIKGEIIIAKYDDITLDDATFDPNAYIDTNGGGNSLIQYCGTSITRALNSIPAASVTTVYN